MLQPNKAMLFSLSQEQSVISQHRSLTHSVPTSLLFKKSNYLQIICYNDLPTQSLSSVCRVFKTLKLPQNSLSFSYDLSCYFIVCIIATCIIYPSILYSCPNINKILLSHYFFFKKNKNARFTT